MSIKAATGHEGEGLLPAQAGRVAGRAVGGRRRRQGRLEDLCLPREDTVGVKCGKGRAEADEWIEEFPDEVTVSPYIGRHGWNVLRIGGAIPVEALVEAIDTSYDLVVATLPKSQRP